MSYQCLQFNTCGKPRDVLKLCDCSLPELEKNLQDGEVILRNLASPIHPSALQLITGIYPSTGMSLPATPGNDTVSVVYKAGPNCKYKVGTRVIPLSGYNAWGEYMKVTEDSILTEVPNEVDDFTACQFVVNGLTAYALISKLYNFKAGEWGLQTAAGSTVGRAVIQIAKLKGINLINLVRREAQAEELRAMGATVVVYDGENDQEAEEKIRSLTQSKGVAFDAVGGRTGSFAMRNLGQNGKFVGYGILSGKPVEMDNAQFIFKNITTSGFWLLRFLEERPRHEIAKISQELMDLLKTRKVNLRYDEVYEYKDYLKALERNQEHGKKVILVPNKK